MEKIPHLPGAQASGPSLAPCLAWAPCLLGQWPESPLHRMTPADAPPDCVLSRIQNRAQGTAVPILWLFMENHGDDFLSPALSGEKRDPFLLWPQAPGCLAWLGGMSATPLITSVSITTPLAHGKGLLNEYNISLQLRLQDEPLEWETFHPSAIWGNF